MATRLDSKYFHFDHWSYDGGGDVPGGWGSIVEIKGSVMLGRIDGYVYRLDEQEKWVEVTKVKRGAALGVYDGKLIAVGSDGFSRNVMVHEEKDKKWTPMPEMKMPFGCAYSCVLSVGRGGLLVIGWEVDKSVPSVLVFDAGKKTWHIGPQLPSYASIVRSKQETPFPHVSAVVYGNLVFTFINARHATEVWYAKISDLSTEGKDSTHIWRQLPDVPLYSLCMCICVADGVLLAIGELNLAYSGHDWEVVGISHMLWHSGSSVTTLLLSDKKLLVVNWKSGQVLKVTVKEDLAKKFGSISSLLKTEESAETGMKSSSEETAVSRQYPSATDYFHYDDCVTDAPIRSCWPYGTCSYGSIVEINGSIMLGGKDGVLYRLDKDKRVEVTKVESGAALGVYDGKLIAVGSDGFSRKVMVHKEKDEKWTPMPEMKMPFGCACSCVLTVGGGGLLVIGWEVDELVPSVLVFDAGRKTWHIGPQLPSYAVRPPEALFAHVSAVVYGDLVFTLKNWSVGTCKVPVWYANISDLSTEGKDSTHVWRKLPDVPLYNSSTCICVADGVLLAIGTSLDKTSILAFSTDQKWEHVEDIHVLFPTVGASLLSDQKLLVVDWYSGQVLKVTVKEGLAKRFPNISSLLKTYESPSLRGIEEELAGIDDWRAVGRNLHVDEKVLTALDTTLQDISARKTAMLKWWLDNDPDVSWNKLAGSLKDIDDGMLGKRILSEHCDFTAARENYMYVRFIDNSKKLCNAIKKEKLEIYHQWVISKVGRQPELCIEIKVPTGEIKNTILKLVEDDPSIASCISKNDLDIIVDPNYEYPLAACCPGDRIDQSSNLYGSVGCYVRSTVETEMWKGCITCYHCVKDKGAMVQVHCSNGGRKEGSCFDGKLDGKHDVCVIKFKDATNTFNNCYDCASSSSTSSSSTGSSSTGSSSTGSSSKHRICSLFPGVCIKKHTLLCKCGQETGQTQMVVLGYAEKGMYKVNGQEEKQSIDDAVIVGTNRGKEDGYDRDIVFHFGDSGSVAVKCDVLPERSCVAGILFAKIPERKSSDGEDYLAYMHPLKDYFWEKNIQIIP